MWKVIRCASTNKQQGKQKRCMCEEKDDDICESLPTQGILSLYPVFLHKIIQVGKLVP